MCQSDKRAVSACSYFEQRKKIDFFSLFFVLCRLRKKRKVRSRAWTSTEFPPVVLVGEVPPVAAPSAVDSPGTGRPNASPGTPSARQPGADPSASTRTSSSLRCRLLRSEGMLARNVDIWKRILDFTVVTASV